MSRKIILIRLPDRRVVQTTTRKTLESVPDGSVWMEVDRKILKACKSIPKEFFDIAQKENLLVRQVGTGVVVAAKDYAALKKRSRRQPRTNKPALTSLPLSSLQVLTTDPIETPSVPLRPQMRVEIISKPAQAPKPVAPPITPGPRLKERLWLVPSKGPEATVVHPLVESYANLVIENGTALIKIDSLENQKSYYQLALTGALIVIAILLL